MSIFIAIVVAFGLGLVFGGAVGWQDAVNGKDWFWKKQKNIWPRR